MYNNTFTCVPCSSYSCTTNTVPAHIDPYFHMIFYSHQLTRSKRKADVCVGNVGGTSNAKIVLESWVLGQVRVLTCTHPISPETIA